MTACNHTKTAEKKSILNNGSRIICYKGKKVKEDSQIFLPEQFRSSTDDEPHTEQRDPENPRKGSPDNISQ